jgi:hypothetical protein
MLEIAAYKKSKLLSSIIIELLSLEIIIDRGVNKTLSFGKSNVQTCYTAAFLSAASFSFITVINI